MSDGDGIDVVPGLRILSPVGATDGWLADVLFGADLASPAPPSAVAGTRVVLRVDGDSQHPSGGPLPHAVVIHRAARRDDWDGVEAVGRRNPRFSVVASALAGLGLAATDPVRASALLTATLRQPLDVPVEVEAVVDHVTVPVAPGLEATRGLDRATIALALLHVSGTSSEEAWAAQQLAEVRLDTHVAIARVAAWMRAKDFEAIRTLTDAIEDVDDATAVLLLHRGVAIHHFGQDEEAKEIVRPIGDEGRHDGAIARAAVRLADAFGQRDPSVAPHRPGRGLVPELVPVESAEAAVLRLAIAQLEASLADIDEQVAQLTLQIESVTSRHRRLVGPVLAALAAFDASADPGVADVGDASTSSFGEDALSKEPDEGRTAPKAPDPELRALYRELARVAHPDKAQVDSDPKQVARMTEMMVAANRAYAGGDVETLRRLAAEWHPENQTVGGDDTLERLRQRREDLARRVDQARQVLRSLEVSAGGRLLRAVRDAEAHGRDHISEVANRLKARLARQRAAAAERRRS